MAITVQNWFSSWFDTPYYHILYKDRGYSEAQLFMRNLTAFLDLKPGSQILDLACGKGRHSIFLNKLGFNVTGVDLSPQSIDYARQFENDSLHFKVQCMCKPLPQKFDAVFNLFTSFGYFERDEDNFRTIASIKDELKEGGYGVIDFMNVKKVIANLVPQEVKAVKGIDFHLTRSHVNGYILKNINFEDEGMLYHFTERVKSLTLNDFQEYFSRAGITLKHVFGNYHLEEFNEKTSDRLILIFQ
jgi:SAM-dependent methyltransferase